MVGPTINMAQGDPSKATAILKRTKNFQMQSCNALKSTGHRIYKLVM